MNNVVRIPRAWGDVFRYLVLSDQDSKAPKQVIQFAIEEDTENQQMWMFENRKWWIFFGVSFTISISDSETEFRFT